jgi:hypothetical protein
MPNAEQNAAPVTGRLGLRELADVHHKRVGSAVNTHLLAGLGTL